MALYKNIKHIFFDLDHTLWDFETNSDLAFYKVFQKNNILIDLTSFLEAYRPINRDFWRLYREDRISKKELRYQRLKTTFDKIDEFVSDETINTIAHEYIEFLPDFNHLFDGTIEILEYLGENYKLHIITNGFEEIQSRKMKSSKIFDYFDQIITSESVGVKKPNARVFNHALDLAHATAENSIMIGDSVEADILGALNVGMKALHCDFENMNAETDAFISIKSLNEIRNYL